MRTGLFENCLGHLEKLQMCSRARGKRPPVYCRCYDDFDCFQPAQQNLLHTIATAPGCVVVLTGDFHFSDIKVNIISNDFEPQKCLALSPVMWQFSFHADIIVLTRSHVKIGNNSTIVGSWMFCIQHLPC
jgi:hypothetical protein